MPPKIRKNVQQFLVGLGKLFIHLFETLIHRGHSGYPYGFWIL